MGRRGKPEYSEDGKTLVSIDGHRVIYTFTILHEGWEMDNTGWVTDDLRLWGTDHGGGPNTETPETLLELIKLTHKSLKGLEQAYSLVTGETPRLLV